MKGVKRVTVYDVMIPFGVSGGSKVTFTAVDNITSNCGGRTPSGAETMHIKHYIHLAFSENYNYY